MSKKRFLAIITARGGSKRLPNKNIMLLDDKPLIAHTIKAALDSEYIDDLIVSTDSKAIADVAQSYGANVPFMRPDSLAQDDTTSIDVIIHATNEYEKISGDEYEYIILLQPTSPLRDSSDIDNGIKEMLDKKADAIIGVTPMEHSPLWSNTLNESRSMEGFLKDELKNSRSQDLPDYFRINGALYVCKKDRLIKEHGFMIKDNIYAHVMSNEHSIDIDTKMDFLIAQTIIKELR
jgi:CMP-N-acetylneuraminic acid synthetase